MLKLVKILEHKYSLYLSDEYVYIFMSTKWVSIMVTKTLFHETILKSKEIKRTLRKFLDIIIGVIILFFSSRIKTPLN